MCWKDVKCGYCRQDLGCSTCGQLFPSLSLIFEKYENSIGDEIIVYFCNNKCRDSWIERKKKFERRTKRI